MRWLEHLYVGEKLAGKEEEVRSAVEAGTCSRDIWVILPAVNGRDQLDLRPAVSLFLPGRLDDMYGPDGIVIYGIAKGKREAVSLVAKIADDCFGETGDAHMAAWLSGKRMTQSTRE